MSDRPETPHDDPTASDEDRERPLIDVSGSLHLAGHAAEALGVQDVPDSAPVIHSDNPEEDPSGEARHHLGSDIATRGAGHAD